MKENIRLRNFIYLEMIFIGLSAVAIPTLIPTFQAEFNLSIAQSSLIPIVSTIGGFFTSIFLSFFASRIGLKRINILFLIVSLSANLFIMFSQNIYYFFIGMGLNGIAISMGLTNASTMLAHLKKELQNYGFFNASFGIGGVISPAIISLLLANQLSYKILFAGLGLMYFFLIFFVYFSSIIENTKYASIKFAEAISIVKKKYVVIVIIIMVIYGGAEQGIITWSGNLFTDGFGNSKEKASLLVSVFWFVFTFGRIVTQFIEDKIGQLKSVLIFSFASIIWLILLISFGNSFFFVAIAFSMSIIFPVMQKYASQRLSSRDINLFNGILFGVINIANVFITGLMGLIGDVNIKGSYIVPIVVHVMIILLIIHLHKWNKKQNYEI